MKTSNSHDNPNGAEHAKSDNRFHGCKPFVVTHEQSEVPPSIRTGCLSSYGSRWSPQVFLPACPSHDRRSALHPQAGLCRFRRAIRPCAGTRETGEDRRVTRARSRELCSGAIAAQFSVRSGIDTNHGCYEVKRVRPKGQTSDSPICLSHKRLGNNCCPHLARALPCSVKCGRGILLCFTRLLAGTDCDSPHTADRDRHAGR